MVTPTFTIGGTVTGLLGAGLILQNNGAADLAVNVDGVFNFPAAVADGTAYLVTVKTNPPSQTCTVANASGNVGRANVTNISVSCAPPAGGGGGGGGSPPPRPSVSAARRAA